MTGGVDHGLEVGGEDAAARRLARAVRGAPLSVVFADGEAVAGTLGGAPAVPLEPPVHLSDEDVYLLLPDDIGMEVIDIFADGDEELALECLRDGVVVLGEQRREGPGRVLLEVEERSSAQALLDGGLPYDAEVWVGGPYDPVEVLNDLDAAQVTVGTRLIDDRGLESILRRRTFVGPSWRAARPVTAAADAPEATYALTRHRADGTIGIEAVLFVEYDELVMLLRPARLAPMGRPFPPV